MKRRIKVMTATAVLSFFLAMAIGLVGMASVMYLLGAF